jgi:hypothetical protein
MKIRYIIAAIAAATITAAIPVSVRAQMPSELRPCLAANPLYVTPKQYQEFGRVFDGRATYHYLYAIYKPAEIPTTVALIKVEGGQCRNLVSQPLSVYESIGKFVPANVAAVLTEAKWRSIQKFKGGAQLIKDLLNPPPVSNSSNEMLQPFPLSPLDRQVLSRISR